MFRGHEALLQDVVAIARTARSATVGWRTIGVRALRTVGRDVVRPIADLDLDLEVPELSSRIRALTAAAPADVDTLVFGIFDGIGDFTGYHLAGARGFDPRLPMAARADLGPRPPCSGERVARCPRAPRRRD